MGKSKERSPAEAFRKQQRKRELERNKRQREVAREIKQLKRADPAVVRAELARLHDLDRQGMLDNAHRAAVTQVAEVYQRKLVEQGGKVPSAAARLRNKQHDKPGPVMGAKTTRRMEPQTTTTPQVSTPATEQPQVTQIVLGTGGLMPTSLKVRREPPKKPTTQALPPPPPPPAAPETEETDEAMAQFEAEMKALGAL